MSSDTSMSLIMILGSFTLVASSLLARQLKLSEVVKMGLAWVAIFGLIFIVIRTYLMVAG